VSTGEAKGTAEMRGMKGRNAHGDETRKTRKRIRSKGNIAPGLDAN